MKFGWVLYKTHHWAWSLVLSNDATDLMRRQKKKGSDNAFNNLRNLEEEN